MEVRLARKSLTRTFEGFESEIELLRRLIESAASSLDSKAGLTEKLAVLETIGKSAPQLARMVKAQRELAGGDLNPAALLRQALDELLQEWPEFKAYCSEFQPQTEEPHDTQS